MDGSSPASTDVLSPGDVDPLELKLVVVSGPDFGRELPLRKGTHRVGKEPGLELTLSDKAVSRTHLVVEVLRAGARFRDNGSTNGSFCDGLRFEILEAPPGAVIRIGRTELQLMAQAEPQPIRPSDAARFGALIGESLAMRRTFALLERAAASNADILIQGETGTGKELAAEAIHAASARAGKPFVVCDLSSVAPQLLESELFGHVRGAFTGAVAERAGAFERARGGTLFLDEVGELPAEVQPRLLRALERRQVKRVGGDRFETLDLRVVAATHRTLETEVQAGRFREDLYHRLAVVTVTMPPLRARPGDIPALVDAILVRLGRGGAGDDLLSAETRSLLRGYDWPGNVRELGNVIERCVSLGTEPDLPPTGGTRRPADAFTSGDLPFKEAKERLLSAFERDYLANVMRRADGNVSQAARDAAVDRAYLHRLLNKHGLAER